MSTFMLLLLGGDFSQLSPAETQAAYQKYMAWSKKLREEGRFVGGEELQAKGKMISSSPDYVVTDGPFTEARETIGGYYAIQADSIEEAVGIAKGCPHLLYGGSIDVRGVIDHSGH